MLIVPGMSWSWAPIEFGYDVDVGRIYGWVEASMKTVLGLRKVRMLRQFYDVTDPIASLQTPLGELTALPRPPSWIQGVLLLRLLHLREGRGREGREGRWKEGSVGEGRGGEGRGRKCRGEEGLPRLEITSGYALDAVQQLRFRWEEIYVCTAQELRWRINHCGDILRLIIPTLLPSTLASSMWVKCTTTRLYMRVRRCWLGRSLH